MIQLDNKPNTSWMNPWATAKGPGKSFTNKTLNNDAQKRGGDEVYRHKAIGKSRLGFSFTRRLATIVSK